MTSLHYFNAGLISQDAFLLCWMLLVLSYAVRSHPQCLDYRPPFVPEKPLEFCREYTDFTCCTWHEDQKIRYKHGQIMRQSNTGGYQISRSCTDHVKVVLCQQCSPYAAHLFDSEATQVIKPLPGLCLGQCQDLYNSCRDNIPLLTQDASILNSLYSSSAFCQQLQLSDPDYCYPDLLTSPVFNQNIVDNTAAEDGCLCIEQFASGLSNALLLETPPDGSGRLFIGEQRGIVYIYYKNGTKLQEPFMDIKSNVLSSSRAGDERGFLGLAFHPNFASNNRFFIYYSIQSGSQQKVRISEFTISPYDMNKVDYGSEKVIIDVVQPYWNHNGGEVSTKPTSHYPLSTELIPL